MFSIGGVDCQKDLCIRYEPLKTSQRDVLGLLAGTWVSFVNAETISEVLVYIWNSSWGDNLGWCDTEAMWAWAENRGSRMRPILRTTVIDVRLTEISLARILGVDRCNRRCPIVPCSPLIGRPSSVYYTTKFSKQSSERKIPFSQSPSRPPYPLQQWHLYHAPLKIDPRHLAMMPQHGSCQIQL
jgi:hypothetical protein